jgi:DNA repair protein RadA/Sms
MAVPGARARRVYVCGACGDQAPRWVGRCPSCGAWDTVAESATAAAPGRWAGASARRPLQAVVPAPVRLDELADAAPARLPTGIGELDRVLGGGLVVGSLVLLGGEPGIGKSTLALQALARLARGHRVMLVTGEESAAQVRARAERLRDDAGPVAVLAETRLE